jgi:hypothetical protein
VARRRRSRPALRPFLVPALVGLVGLALIAAVLLASGGPAAEPAARHGKGSAAAPVVVEEWGDFG